MENKFDSKHFSREQIEAAMACKTPEELVALAKEHGVTLTAEEAKEYFAELENFELDLSDEQLKAVAGGSSDCYGDVDPSWMGL